MSTPINPVTHKGQWIRRRARRIGRFYGVDRRLAIFDAWQSWIDFVAPQRVALHIVK